MFDLVLRSTRILADTGWQAGAIGIRDGRIAALLAPADTTEQAEVIDVGDQFVIPGLIDTHAHFREPGYEHKEDITSGTTAALAGGVTSVFDMPNVNPPTNTAERLASHLAAIARKSCADMGHNASGVIPENIAAIADGGTTAFKVWMMQDIGRDYPHPPGTSITDHAVLYRVFEEVQKTGRPLYVHPHDQQLYSLFVQRAQEQWGMDFRSYARALRGGDGVVLNTAIATILEFQRSTKARLHVLHLSTRDGIDMVRRAKEEGRPVTAEANPFALFVTSDWQKIEERGPYALGFWVPEPDVEPMWQAVADGTIDVIGSDHGPHTKEEKEVGWTDMYTAPGGSPFIEQYLRLLLTEVNRGRLTLERVVELCCRAPARLTGYWPRKGSVSVGADADLVVLDMDHEEVLHVQHSHYRCGWMPAENLTAKGRPVMTLLRGRVVADGGKVSAEPGTGQVLRP